MKQEIVITLERQDDITIFDLDGDLTADSEPFVKDAYAAANQEGTAKIILKFHEDAYINSAGIAILIQLLAEANGCGQVVAIAGLSDHFETVFDFVGVTKFAKTYASLEAARAALS